MFQLTGKTALVTGATGGIGRAIVKTLHDLGATIAITDNNYSDFKSYLTKEIPKVLNSVLMKKGIR